MLFIKVDYVLIAMKLLFWPSKSEIQLSKKTIASASRFGTPDSHLGPNDEIPTVSYMEALHCQNWPSFS